MAITNRELVSRVENQLRTLTKDTNTSRRFILFTAQNIAATFIARKAESFKLYKQDDLYTTIECFELEKINSVSCDIVEFKTCTNLMKSKEKLPKMVYTKQGNSIKEVTAIDGSDIFGKATLSQYRRDQIRGGTSKLSYYVSDGYLYIPNTEIEVVRVVLLTTSPSEALSASSCADDCCDVFDLNFISPEDILENVIEQTLQQILIRVQITPDENSNMNENEK